MWNDEGAERDLFACSEQVTHYLRDWKIPKNSSSKSQKTEPPKFQKKIFGTQTNRRVPKITEVSRFQLPAIEKNQTNKDKSKSKKPAITSKRSRLDKVVSLDKFTQGYKISTPKQQGSGNMFSLKENHALIQQQKQLKLRGKMKKIQKMEGGKSANRQLTIDEIKEMIMKQLGRGKNKSVTEKRS